VLINEVNGFAGNVAVITLGNFKESFAVLLKAGKNIVKL